MLNKSTQGTLGYLSSVGQTIQRQQKGGGADQGDMMSEKARPPTLSSSKHAGHHDGVCVYIYIYIMVGLGDLSK